MFYTPPAMATATAEGWYAPTMHPMYAVPAAFPAGMPIETPQAAAWRNRLSAPVTGQHLIGQHPIVANRFGGSGGSPEMRLQRAASDGDLPTLAMLLDQGLHADSRAAHEFRPLIVALLTGQTDAAKLLIERGGEVNGLPGTGDSPLGIAAERGNVDIAMLLLDQGAELEARDAYGCTPLLRAVQSGQYPMVDMLINRGADVGVGGPYGATPLHVAVSTHRQDLLFLVARGRAPLEAKDEFGNTALSLAEQLHNWPAVDYLKSEPERRELALKLLPGILRVRAQAPAMSADSQGGFPVPSHLPPTQVAMPTPTTHRR